MGYVCFRGNTSTMICTSGQVGEEGQHECEDLNHVFCEHFSENV